MTWHDLPSRTVAAGVELDVAVKGMHAANRAE
jgi:hypothetical protein